jgi:hypothetical protein
MLSQNVSASTCSLSSDKNTYSCAANVDNLVNGQSYSFALTVVSTNNVESALSGQVIATPTDKITPAVPTNLKATLNGSNVIFSWTSNTDDTTVYRLYHGVSSGQYGESVDSAGTANSLSYPLSQLSNDSQYFALSAIDSSGNESGKSTEKVFYFNVADNPVTAWVRAVSPSEVPVNTSCLVKMDIDPASSTKPICTDNLNFTNPGFFEGTIKYSGVPYCAVSDCTDFNPNKCIYGVGSWTNHCYVPSK